jgi:hypothetical protein
MHLSAKLEACCDTMPSWTECCTQSLPQLHHVQDVLASAQLPRSYMILSLVSPGAPELDCARAWLFDQPPPPPEPACACAWLLDHEPGQPPPPELDCARAWLLDQPPPPPHGDPPHGAPPQPVNITNSDTASKSNADSVRTWRQVVCTW